MRTDPRIRTEAAVWLARLRSELRSPADEAGFQTWLSEAEDHRRAFESATAAFDAAGAVSLPHWEDDDERQPFRPARRHVLAGIAASAIATVTAGGLVWWRADSGVIAGEIGRPRTFALPDGSRIVLDTKSSVQVALSDERRLIRLLAGRARFDVAKDAARPFIVQSGERQVIAVGTAFTVAAEDDRTSVVLEEGRVIVRSRSGDRGAAAYADVGMAPGDRMVFHAGATAPAEDRPDLAKLSAWQTGRLVFEEETLFEASAELNRYNHRTLEIEDAGSASLRISGVFRADDPEAFARSVAMILPVEVQDNGERILIRSRNS